MVYEDNADGSNDAFGIMAGMGRGIMSRSKKRYLVIGDGDGYSRDGDGYSRDGNVIRSKGKADGDAIEICRLNGGGDAAGITYNGVGGTEYDD